MALANLAKKPGPSDIPHKTCQVCYALATIEPSEAEGLHALLANPQWRYTDIRDAVADDPDTPLHLHEDAISRHVRGRCGAGVKLR